jgi:Zn-finger nucleic acid-binding protein
MNVQAREGIEVDICVECGGMWFDAGELHRLLQKHARLYSAEEVKDIRKTISPPNKITERVQYIKCPGCGQLMNRVNYGKFSGVIVDKCRDHGLWLDRGEFEKMAEFVSKGGLELEKAARAEDDARAKLGQTSFQRSVLPAKYDDGRPRMRTGKNWLEAVLADIFGFGRW